jgi:hypothetical protein
MKTNSSPRVQQIGSAYDHEPPSHDGQLTSTGKGTPGGELLRRYWHPIVLTSQSRTCPCKCACWAKI